LKPENEPNNWTKFSGKTVLKSLLGIHTPESGKICFDGRVYSELEPDEKRELRTEIEWFFKAAPYLIR
jgi:phospholipid/cholesterol/gamma-HCH transport system ATP-binding protein